ncbi:HNH endonuclease [Erwinia amylovora]|uniref:HNH endonuclease n=1 Tax=Erwinia amylovora TaxID=552 RepID=UPI000C089A86|nr:HNH endonuclease [Erwinia amylovora]
MKLSKTTREKLRKQFSCGCAFCGSPLPPTGWHAEQIGEEYVEGGLIAICKECRTTKGNATTETFRALLAEQVERARRHSINFRTALRFGLCRVKKEPIVFWFEQCQSSNAVTATQDLTTAQSTASAA